MSDLVLVEISVLHVLGVDHKIAGVADRERAAIAPAETEERLRGVRGQAGVAEAMVVSTCNRVEWILVSEGTAVPCGLFPEGIEAGQWHGDAAVERLLRLACGLESIALGEPQILGQLNSAWQAAQAAGTAGPVLRFLMPRLLGAAKRVRKNCGLGLGSTSVSHLAAELALAECDRPDPSVLLIGAGKMSGILARQLRTRGISTLHVANRTYSGAIAFGETHGACPVDYHNIYPMLAEVDIVFCACAAPHPVILPEHLRGIERKLLLVDLAVPRNIAPEVRGHSAVSLIDLDDIQRAAAPGHEIRQRAAQQAELVLQAEVPRLIRRCRERSATAELAEMARACDAWREKELARARRKLKSLADHEWAEVEALAWRLARKIAHQPIVARRRAASALT